MYKDQGETWFCEQGYEPDAPIPRRACDRPRPDFPEPAVVQELHADADRDLAALGGKLSAEFCPEALPGPSGLSDRPQGLAAGS